MMNRNLFRMTVLLLFILSLPAYCQDEASKNVITTGSLFEELIDLDRLAQFPDPGYRILQFSSYDRRSNLPGGLYWFANSDGFGNEPIPNFEKVLREPDENGIGEYLMMDVEGSGAIVRLWTAAISGNIRLYIDNNKEPLYDGDAITFLQRTYDIFPENEQ
ncbi:MAG: hypothetical protein AMS27_10940, partial [Bacteroides sp. SM23_62_1]